MNIKSMFKNAVVAAATFAGTEAIAQNDPALTMRSSNGAGGLMVQKTNAKGLAVYKGDLVPNENIACSAGLVTHTVRVKTTYGSAVTQSFKVFGGNGATLVEGTNYNPAIENAPGMSPVQFDGDGVTYEGKACAVPPVDGARWVTNDQDSTAAGVFTPSKHPNDYCSQGASPGIFQENAMTFAPGKEVVPTGNFYGYNTGDVVASGSLPRNIIFAETKSNVAGNDSAIYSGTFVTGGVTPGCLKLK